MIRLVVPVFVLTEGASFALKVYLSDHSSTWLLVSELSALMFFAASIYLSTHYVNSLQDEIMAKVRLKKQKIARLQVMANSSSEATLVYDLHDDMRKVAAENSEPTRHKKSSSKKVIVKASNLIFDKLISVDRPGQMDDNSTF